MVDQHRVPGRAPHTAPGHLQQLPALRPQPQHGRARGKRDVGPSGSPAGLPRPRPALPPRSARGGCGLTRGSACRQPVGRGGAGAPEAADRRRCHQGGGQCLPAMVGLDSFTLVGITVEGPALPVARALAELWETDLWCRRPACSASSRNSSAETIVNSCAHSWTAGAQRVGRCRCSGTSRRG